MSETVVNYRVLTPRFRISYPNLIEPRAYQERKDNKSYSVQAVFPENSLDKFKYKNENKETSVINIDEFFQKIAFDMWGESLDIVSELAETWPIKSGNDILERDEVENEKIINLYKDTFCIRFKSAEEYPPRLMFIENRKTFSLDRNLNDMMAKALSLFSAGNYAVAEISIRPQSVMKKKFLTCYLNGIVYVGQGESISSGISMIDENIDNILDQISDDDIPDDELKDMLC